MRQFIVLAFITGMSMAMSLLPAHALPVRTFVATTGNDANPCSLFAPCRTLQRGIDAVNSGGDVLIQDSGGFGSNVFITKSVSVFAAPGAQAGVRSAEGSSFYITGADISVFLSGLRIVSTDGSDGIYFDNGESLSLHDVVIDVVGVGVGVLHYVSNGHVSITNSVFRNASIGFFASGQKRPGLRVQRSSAPVLKIVGLDFTRKQIRSSRYQTRSPPSLAVLVGSR